MRVASYLNFLICGPILKQRFDVNVWDFMRWMFYPWYGSHKFMRWKAIVINVGIPCIAWLPFKINKGRAIVHAITYHYMQKIIYIPCVGDLGLNDNLSRGRFYLYWRVEAASMFKGKGAFEVFAFFPQYLITTMQRTLKLVLTVLCIYFNIMP